LRFPSNGETPANAFVAFQFIDPHRNGLPIWGPNGAGVTYLWKFRPRQQSGYYVTFWWSNNGTFLWKAGGSDSYYGCHPYPRGGGSSTTLHDWELAGMSSGSDNIVTLAGATKPVVKDAWYTQGFRVAVNGNGTKTGRFYTALPSMSNADIVERTTPPGWGDALPPSPAVTFGDSPWYAEYQHERLGGILGPVKIFNKLLSETDTLSEAADMSRLVTAEGRAAIWWGKRSFDSADSLTCDYSTGRTFVWASTTKAVVVDI
jgi:hypothetical protein